MKSKKDLLDVEEINRDIPFMMDADISPHTMREIQDGNYSSHPHLSTYVSQDKIQKKENLKINVPVQRM